MKRKITLGAAVVAIACLLGLPSAQAQANAANAAGPGNTASPAAGRWTPSVRTVASVDLERYQGRWRQLAAVPAAFQAECARDVNAEYTVLRDGLVQVINTCVREDGSLNRIEGRARSVDTATNAKLEVTFVQIAGEWQFQFAGDYWIIGLARDYRWAVVGDPDRSGGFVLARTPKLTGGEIARVFAAILRSGYDPCRFRLTATTGGLDTERGLCELPTRG